MPRGSTAVLRPNLGLWFNAPLLALPDGALSDGHNFRIQNGKLSNLNLGWTRFGTWQLGLNIRGTFTGDPPSLIDGYFDRDSNQALLFCTSRFIFRRVSDSAIVLLNRRYETGTVSVTNGSATVTGSGTLWNANLAAGDFIRVGATGVTDPTVVWHEIQSVGGDTSLTLTATYTGATASGQAYTGLKAFTGTLDTPWEAVTFLHEGVADEDLWIATNGVDEVVTWNGTATEVSLAGLSFKAFHIALHKNMLIALDIVDTGESFPTQMRNSNPGFPLDFSTGLASAFTIHDGSDAVNAALPIGDSLAVYSERNLVIADFVGDPFVFVLRTAVPNIGPITGRLVADFGDEHLFLGPDAQYSFNGVTVEESGEHVWREVLRQRDPARTLRAHSHFDEENGDLLWAIPLATDVSAGGPEVAWSEHYLEDTGRTGVVPVSKRAFPFTATGFFERQATLTWADIQDQWQDLNFRWNDIFFEAAFPFNLAGAADGKVYTFGTSQTADGVLLPSHVRAGRRPLGDSRMRGLLARIYPFATFFPGRTLAVRTRLSDSAAGPVAVVDEQTLSEDLPEHGYFVSPFRAGRFFELEFASTGTAWELAGWDIDIRPGGRR